MPFDETNRIATVGIEYLEPTSQEQVRQIVQHTNDLIDLLRSQKVNLRHRGMTLPTDSLENVNGFQKRLNALNKELSASASELRTLRALAETTALITSSLDTDTVLNQVMDTVIRLTGAERGYIVLKDRATGKLDQFRVARGLDKEQLAIGSSRNGSSENASRQTNEYMVSRTIVEEVAQTGKPVLTDNASQDERYLKKESVVLNSLRSILAVPLNVRGELIGVVYCDNRVLPDLFQPRDRDLVNAFANQAAVAIENARLFEEAQGQLAQITELRDLLQNIFTSITSGVLTTDGSGIITDSNPATYEILEQQELVGKPLTEALPDMPAVFYEALRQAQHQGQQRLIEVQPTLSNGGKRYWNVNITRLRGNTSVQQSAGLALVFDDVTEQREREAQLKEISRYLPVALIRNIRSVDEIDIGGQEREITAMFADVRDFTSFSEKLEPEVLMRVINRYLAVASDAVNLYGGIVEKYLGDAVTGLFNTQLNAQEDHAVRAVRAGMSLLYDLFALHEELPEEQRLYYGIGIHTGMAVLGNVGGRNRKEFAALGDATQISKILQESARGTVVISPATYEYVKDVFDCERIELVTNKGRSDLTHGYRVMRHKRGKGTSLLIDGE
jgi:adenylate cyclase